MSPELILLLSVFFRFVIGTVFVVSLTAKLRSLSNFKQTIQNFDILPKTFQRSFAYLAMIAEGVVILCMVAGDMWLIAGFLLAGFLLIVFSFALLSVLHRKLQIGCNCFGKSKTVVSNYDIWRNIGFLFCALLGVVFRSSISPHIIEILIISIPAIMFVGLWTNLSELVSVFNI